MTEKKIILLINIDRCAFALLPRLTWQTFAGVVVSFFLMTQGVVKAGLRPARGMRDLTVQVTQAILEAVTAVA